jgi:capsular polysaccharide transport system permease protein
MPDDDNTGRLRRLIQGKHFLALAVIVAPMVLATIYFGLIARDRYVSESKIVVKKSADQMSQTATLALPVLGFGTDSVAEDALHLKEFIHSPEMLARLDQRLGLKDAYALRGLDVIYMLPSWATREDFLDYYRRRVELGYDEKMGVLTIRTQGFTADFALALNEAILQEAEKFINEISHRIAREQMEFAGAEVARARKSLDKAQKELVEYQNEHGMLDPAAVSEAAIRIVAELEGQLAAKEAELKALSGTLQDDAAQLVALRQTIQALREQIKTERAKLASQKGGTLNQLLASYQDRKALVDFEVDLYKVSLSAYEKTRVEAARKVRNLAVIVAPHLPEEAEYPRRLLALGAALFILVLAYGLLRLTLAIIEDHRD